MASSQFSTSSICSQVTSAFASRIPILSNVRRRLGRISEPTPLCAPEPQRTRSSSTSSVDSTATTIVASGTTTPSTRSIPQKDLCMSRVDAAIQRNGSTTRGGSIDRDAATIGTTLATSALSRLEADTADSAGREMYIVAVKYMMKGLPEDLSDAEREALVIPGGTIVRPAPSSVLTTRSTESAEGPNFIRSSSARIVSLMLSAFFSLLMVGIPIFAILFARFMEYERRHRLSEKAVESTRNLAGVATTAVVRASQSRSGAYCLTALLCGVQSILEGANDGINESTVGFSTTLHRVKGS